MSSTNPEPPVTGHPAIDSAVAALDLSGPVHDHADGFQQLHSVLQKVLNPNIGPPGTCGE